jgi:hypothetical protein
MNWKIAIAAVFVLWSSTSWGATLTWEANSEPDLAGYRVYQCTAFPCTKSSGNVLATLGKVTSFNIGTPSVTQFYFITAYDIGNNESGNSNVATFTPAGSPPSPPPMGTVSLTIVGTPATRAWGVRGSIADSRNVMADIYHDGRLVRTEREPPYCNFTENAGACGTGSLGIGQHTVEFVFKLENTTTELGRATVTVQEGNPPPPPPLPPTGGNVTLTIVGSPANRSWGVQGSIADTRNVMADIYHDGRLVRTEREPPYCNFTENAGACGTGSLGTGLHMVDFVFKLEGTTTELGRATATVQEGSPSPPPPPPPPVGTVTLTIVGNPATGPWGVRGSTTDLRDVMARVYLDQILHHLEHNAPYGFPGDNGTTATTGLFGTGTHTVEFVFYLEGTTTEIGRASLTVREG